LLYRYRSTNTDTALRFTATSLPMPDKRGESGGGGVGLGEEEEEQQQEPLLPRSLEGGGGRGVVCEGDGGAAVRGLLKEEGGGGSGHAHQLLVVDGEIGWEKCDEVLNLLALLVQSTSTDAEYSARLGGASGTTLCAQLGSAKW
jgi:hypothetical protein